MSLRGLVRPESAELAAYFGLTFAISWSCWLPAVFSNEGVDTHWVQTLVYAGIAGPLIASVALLHLCGSRAQREDFRDRVSNLSRLGPSWIVAIALIYPLLTMLAVGLDWVLSGHGPDMRPLLKLLSNPLYLAAHLVLVLALGPFPEELGWRGYALDRLQVRWTALASSLLLGVAWATWHLPLFFVKGTYQNGLGFGGLEFWLFNLTAIAASVLMTCVYNNNDRSVLSAIFVHAVLNLTRGVVILPATAELARTALLIALAFGVVIVFGARTMDLNARRPRGRP